MGKGPCFLLRPKSKEHFLRLKAKPKHLGGSTHLCVFVERGNAKGLPVGFGVQFDPVDPFYELLIRGEPVQLSSFSSLSGRRKGPGKVRGKEGLPRM